MHKQRLLRTPLVAVLGLLAFLVVPAAAQAHHIDLTATCKLVGNAPTVEYRVDFIGFSTDAKPTTKGNVKVDGTVVKSVPPSTIAWNTNPGTLPGTAPGTAGQVHSVKADFQWKVNGQWKSGSVTKSTGTCPTPPRPGIEIVKNGPSTRYVGQQATFTYKVENTGNVVLSNPVVTDDKCSPVTKVPDGQNQFDPGDIWTYTCTTTITDAMGDELVNVGKACAEPPGKPKICDEDDHKTKIPKPAIVLDKTGAATAAAGSTFTYTFKATNIGNVTLTNVVLTDDRCQATLTRTDPNAADPTFDKGDSWYYTCTVTAPNGPAQVDNLANVCGDFAAPGVDKKTVCDDDPHTFTVPPPPSDPPTTPPPPSDPPSTTPPSTTPPSTTPPGTGVLPEEVVSGRAVLRGPSGCVKRAFRARVRGRSIASVTFFVDGRRVKKIRGSRASYTLKVRPGRFGFGRHRIIARVKFTAASGTETRRLPLTFRRCAQGTVAPRFTG